MKPNAVPAPSTDPAYERRCLICGTDQELTVHHLLPKGSKRKGISRPHVTLCWECHLPLHKGGKQIEQWRRLWPLLSGGVRHHVAANCDPDTVFGKRILEIARGAVS